jgi:hypothetical protein
MEKKARGWKVKVREKDRAVGWVSEAQPTEILSKWWVALR